MKKHISLLLVIFFVLNISAKQNSAYLDYIEKYKDIAIREMDSYNIPASITLAQGLLESGAGNSDLAKRSNNHFGIKCRGNAWKGDRVYHDDDEKGECFRKYDSVLDSYEDHSKFLVNGNRYDFLFGYSNTDYKSWAKGLKKAGYATDPKYPNRLIKIIEDYNLHQYDTQKKSKRKKKKNSAQPEEEKKSFWSIFRFKKKAEPTAPTQEEREVNKVYKEENYIAEISPYRTHEISKINGVKHVIALPGDTYQSIAEEFEMYEKELLKANEVQYGAEPKAGDIVFLRKKKKKGSKGTYTVQKGETIYEISQKTGIRVRTLYKINDLVYGKQKKEGDIIKLR